MAKTAETQKAHQPAYEIDEKSGSAGLTLDRCRLLFSSIFCLSLHGTGFEARCDMTPDDLRELRRWINAEIGEDEE